jgi:hypothetical protein
VINKTRLIDISMESALKESWSKEVKVIFSSMRIRVQKLVNGAEIVNRLFFNKKKLKSAH